jgi:D-alanyl-D-alanine carboxypeptidase
MAQGMTKEEAERITGQSLAIPGHSEHHTGLAMDINSGGGSYEWMAENCWDYGFIVRYPDDHMDITGIIYEPWHFRYVGVELAQELKNYCCMEEYFAELTQQQKNIPD